MLSARRRLRLRWLRHALLWRARRAGRALQPLANRTSRLRPGDALAVLVVRDEMAALPLWFDHHRSLGVGHILAVDNGSVDGTREWLLAQPDVSLWEARGSYRAARFGMDWANALLHRFGPGRWCLTLDADERLLLPHGPERGLQALTEALTAAGREALPCLMIDLYGGPASEGGPGGGGPWFDAGGLHARRQPRFGHMVVRGGPRGRLLFPGAPHRAPVLSKLPLVRWRRGYAYVDSTHHALPSALNRALDALDPAVGLRAKPAGSPTGVLLHGKLLPGLGARARRERDRGEHGRSPAYYEGLAGEPDLWWPGAQAFEGWRQLEALGLMTRGDWA